MSVARPRVLFLCTGNSCRSQMAEGWARHLLGELVEPYSAGIETHGVNANAVKVMAEAGVDISRQRSKHLNELNGIAFDLVVTVCGHAHKHCPVFPGRTRVIHVAFDDPPRLAASARNKDEAISHYRRVRDEIRDFVARIPGMLSHDLGQPGAEAAFDDALPPAIVEGSEAGGARKLNIFERYLTLWVAICMVAGVALGRIAPGFTDALRRLEFGSGSQINIPIAVLIWLMIYPMMLKVDFASVLDVGKRPRGLIVTLVVNWFIKPFSMALIGYVFFKHLFLPWIGTELADQYIAGVIILAAAPCTAMVFVWSYLTRGDPAYTLVQVAANDLIMLALFAPIVKLLVSGASSLTVPFMVLLYAVVFFIVIPLAGGAITRTVLTRTRGVGWFEGTFLPNFHPVAVLALLATLVLIFAFQADNITGRFVHVILIAIPITIQVYFNSSLAYGLMRLLKVPFEVAAPGALIGASNFFELAVATAIALYGPESGAALATVVGVLVEVPVMLSVCAVCNRTRGWFPPAVESAQSG